MGLLITEFPSVIVQEIEKQAAEITKFIILRTWQNLTLPPEEGGTPRRTGHASASWIISIGEPSSDVGGSQQSVDFGPAAQGLQELHGYTLEQGAVFIVNNTPYIARLNFGWSSQASAGFVERAHQRALNEADTQFRDL